MTATLPDLSRAWLVIIDPQRIFADPQSQWCAPRFSEIVDPISSLVDVFGSRTVVTRWIPGRQRNGSWKHYFQTWSFADRADDDPYFDLVDAALPWQMGPTVDRSTFGKWGPELETVTGPYPTIVVAGVSTDCCVITTALAAADAGATVVVAADGCAGSDDGNHQAALTVLGLYEPQIFVANSADIVTALT